MEIVCRCCDVYNLPIALLDLLPQSWVHLRYHIRVVIAHLLRSRVLLPSSVIHEMNAAPTVNRAFRIQTRKYENNFKRNLSGKYCSIIV